MRIINATELARHTRAILDAVFSHGETIAVKRNHTTIAKIVAPERTMTAAQALAEWRPMLTAEQADAWLQDSRNGFDDRVRDPWE